MEIGKSKLFANAINVSFNFMRIYRKKAVVLEMRVAELDAGFEVFICVLCC